MEITSYSGFRSVLQNNFDDLIEVIENRLVQLPFALLNRSPKRKAKCSHQWSSRLRCYLGSHLGLNCWLWSKLRKAREVVLFSIVWDWLILPVILLSLPIFQPNFSCSCWSAGKRRLRVEIGLLWNSNRGSLSLIVFTDSSKEMSRFCQTLGDAEEKAKISDDQGRLNISARVWWKSWASVGELSERLRLESIRIEVIVLNATGSRVWFAFIAKYSWPSR